MKSFFIRKISVTLFIMLFTIIIASLTSLGAETGTFSITYLDVGQGDAAIVQCDNHYMMIDGGDSNQSSHIYSYLKSHNITHLDYVINSHPHDDHIGGLSGALNYATADYAFCPVDQYDSRPFESFKKYAAKSGASVQFPDFSKVYSLGNASFRFLGPLEDSESLNDMSLIMFLQYGHTSFLFTGDMELEEENSLLNHGAVPEADVLKIGHHGSDSSSSYFFLRTVKPKYAVISVGAENIYGHPHEALLSRLNDAGVKTFRTDLNGTITCFSNGSDIVFQTEKEPLIPLIITETHSELPITRNTESLGLSDANVYVLNTNSRRFHLPSCSSVSKMKEKNKEFSSKSREDLISEGYRPCGNCHP